MAVASPTEASPSFLPAATEVEASESTSPDHDDPSDDIQSATILRSEEYRQLFRLPPEEVLVEDFNCAYQENILIQGHMYLFVHYICFYSNIFGFETKKLIPFHDVTSVRRAKTAGIFPNAIEIFAAGKKYFFASFLSRDEAFKLINDGWLQHCNGATALIEQQESTLAIANQENVVASEDVTNDQFDSADRNIDNHTSKDPEVRDNVEDRMESTTVPEVKNIVEEDMIPVVTENADSSSSSSSVSLMWKQENREAPKIPEGYTMVAESQFPMKVEDFFNCFFSDNAVDFVESFHKNCGDKEFKCNSWHPHENYGHARDVSFQHPIKLYFGAKFGGCQETQKFCLYKNSHLVIETSQEVSDVPYSDYFCVEALWDVERVGDESSESCFLRVYVNVAFSKRTVWKGKIVQSTLEECREAYATWINMARELLKKTKKKLESQQETVVSEIHSEIQEKASAGIKSREECFKRQNISSHTVSVNQQVSQGKSVDALFASRFREFAIRLYSSLKTQGNLSLVVVIIVFVILLMQLSIVCLLARPQVQHVHVHSPVSADYIMNVVGGKSSSEETMVWLEKRVHHLKDEMYMVEARLERMQNEHALLKAQLEGLRHSIVIKTR